MLAQISYRPDFGAVDLSPLSERVSFWSVFEIDEKDSSKWRDRRLRSDYTLPREREIFAPLYLIEVFTSE